MPKNELALDLLSTSQTHSQKEEYVDTETGEKGRSPPKESDGRCIYGAPLVALVLEGGATIGQACCNHWDCPTCGVKRAKQEYRRIVAGCEALAMGHELYFWTITCRGRECTYDEAMQNYLAWTNRLFTNARKKCKEEGGHWAYVQVTEHQQKTRAHPHSHIITTFLPSDALGATKDDGSKVYTSAWFARANFTAGLGSQHKISHVKSAAGVSRYVAKYMFKSALLERWPPKWKRVRYSSSWPSIPPYRPIFVAVLRSSKDWRNAEKVPQLFRCETPMDYELARHHIGNILPPSS